MLLIRSVCFVVLFFISSCFAAAGEKVVNLASGERDPFVGIGLPEYGYAHEVVKEAFLREGYKLNVSFYPWARANALVNMGRVDGIMPIHMGDQPDSGLIWSSPFPGDSVGLLKRKNDPYEYPFSPESQLEPLLATLSGKRIGIVRESGLLPEVKAFPDIQIVDVVRDLQSLDMLHAKRIDFALINRHTAARLMIDMRPHYIGQLEFIHPPLANKNFHVAFTALSGRAGILADAFNRGLESMKQDGTLRDIEVRHGLFPRIKSGKDQVHLTIGTVNNPDMKIMRALSSEFEKEHPHIKLKWQEMGENILRRRLLGDFALSEAHYDVMTVGNYEVPLWAKNGWIFALSDFSEEYDLEDIFFSLREALSYQDKLYALPFYAESIMTYYRKDLFNIAGIQMPVNPSFTDIKRFARAIHSPEQGVYGICLRGKSGWGQNTAVVASLVNAFGGRWFNQQWEPQLNSPEWKTALTFYTELLALYGPPNVDQNGYIETLELFLQGQCGMWIDATVAAGQLFNPELSQVADKVGFASAPSSAIQANWLWSWNLVVSQYSENKAAAETFIKWATSKPYIQKVAKTAGWVSVPAGTRSSTYMAWEYARVAPFSTFVLNALENASIRNATKEPVPYIGVQYVGIPEFVGIGSQIGDNISQVLRGNLTVKEALAQSQYIINKQMRASGYLK